jgi:hypothetical protein
MDALSSVFSANSLPRPSAWGDVSEQHLEVMTRFTNDVHKGLEKATLDAGGLIDPQSHQLGSASER